MCAEKYVIFTKKPDKRLAIVQSSFSHGSHFPVKGKNSLHVMSFCIWHVIIVLLNTFIGRKNGGSAHSIFVHFKCCFLNFDITNLNIIYKHCYEHRTKSKSILVQRPIGINLFFHFYYWLTGGRWLLFWDGTLLYIIEKAKGRFSNGYIVFVILSNDDFFHTNN